MGQPGANPGEENAGVSYRKLWVILIVGESQELRGGGGNAGICYVWDFIRADDRGRGCYEVSATQTQLLAAERARCQDVSAAIRHQ